MDLYNGTDFSDAPAWGKLAVGFDTHVIPDAEALKPAVEDAAKRGAKLFYVNHEKTTPPSLNVSGWMRMAETLNRIVPAGMLWTVYGLGGHQLTGRWPVQSQEDYRWWLQESATMWPVLQAMPAIAPSLYLWIDGDEAVTRFRQDAECDGGVLKHTRKPVLPFISPVVLDASNRLDRPMVLKTWMTVLAICKQLFDGAIVWGGMTLNGGWQKQSERAFKHHMEFARKAAR